MYLQQNVKINLQISIETLLLLHLQQIVTIVNRNLPRDESLANENVCTVLFGRNRLKITIKRHREFCVRQCYTKQLMLVLRKI